MSASTVLIADGNRRLAAVLADLLADEPEFTVVGIVSSAVETLTRAQALQPDVVLVSEQLDQGPGHAVCASLRAVAPEATVLLWTSDLVLAATPGVDGVLERGMTFREMVKQVRRTRRRRREAPAVVRLDEAPAVADR